MQGGKSSAGQLVGHTDNVKALVMSEDGRYVSPKTVSAGCIGADVLGRCYPVVRIPPSSKSFRANIVLALTPSTGYGPSQPNAQSTHSPTTRHPSGPSPPPTPTSNVSTAATEPETSALPTSPVSPTTGRKVNVRCSRGTSGSAGRGMGRRAWLGFRRVGERSCGRRMRGRMWRGGWMLGRGRGGGRWAM